MWPLLLATGTTLSPQLDGAVGADETARIGEGTRAQIGIERRAFGILNARIGGESRFFGQARLRDLPIRLHVLDGGDRRA